MDPAQWKPDNTPKSFFNRLKHELVVELLDDNNKPMKIVVPSMTLVTYPTYIADRIISRLVDELMNEEYSGFQTADVREKVLAEILV